MSVHIRSLYSRLGLGLSLIALAVAAALYVLSIWTSEQYHKELTQSLHRNLAQYVIDHLPGSVFLNDEKRSEESRAGSSNALGDERLVNKKVLKGIAMNTMMINPNVEVYLIDLEGNILGHALPEASVDGGQVSMVPINEWLSGAGGAVLGDNPRDKSEQNIFSVAPVYADGAHRGYLYIVLASLEARTLAQTLQSSYVARVVLMGVVLIVLGVLACAWILNRHINGPLRELVKKIKSFRSERFSDVSVHARGEVEELEVAFDLMVTRLQEQFDQINQNDRLRRELVSNISHDLRTPLASIQGYIETLLLKGDSLDQDAKQRYLTITHRRIEHLNTMVGQLFELSKLEAGRVVPHYELFSITELVFDLAQDYELKAQQAGIELKILAPDKNLMVNADISLIQRVCVNLIDNAFSHSAAGDKISLVLEEGELMEEDKHTVCIRIKDEGSGISEEDLPFVFNRYYQSTKGGQGAQKGAGLGLSIVQKIVELHGSLMQVRSKHHEGAEFSFALPVSAQA